MDGNPDGYPDDKIKLNMQNIELKSLINAGKHWEHLTAHKDF